MEKVPPILTDTSVLALTKEGERELREPGTALAPSLLEALVLIGGHSTVAEVIKRGRSMHHDVLQDNLNELIRKNLVSVNAEHALDVIDPGDFFTSSAAYAVTPKTGEAIPAEIDADAEFLRRNGYYVNMARLPAAKPPRTDENKLVVLIVDDDPDISKVLRMFLKLENLDARAAANREEVVAAFRVSPLPDLVLLDVRLTDVNGFDILARMRQHPVLKEVPVIMLTAEANREAVLRGMLGGANGFVTKPFQIRPLIKAVKTVLGLKLDPE